MKNVVFKQIVTLYKYMEISIILGWSSFYMQENLIKIQPIKIENKREWINRFQKKVKVYTPNEDYVNEEYLQKYAQKKEFSIDILKGKYVIEDDTIILISLQSKMHFFNTGMMYYGKFIQYGSDVYLEGEATLIYPNYIREIIKSPVPIMLLIVAIYGTVCDKEFLYTVIAILIFLFIFLIVDKKITIKDEKEHLIRNIESI